MALFVAGAGMTWCAVLLLPRRTRRHEVIRHVARSFLSLTGQSPKVEVEEPSLRRACCSPSTMRLSRSFAPFAVIPGPLSFVAGRG